MTTGYDPYAPSNGQNNTRSQSYNNYSYSSNYQKNNYAQQTSIRTNTVNNAPQPFTISQVKDLVSNAIDNFFTKMIVATGEISNFKIWQDRNFYFSLSDRIASIKCVVYGITPALRNLNLQNGQQVIIYATAPSYSNRGELQFVVKNIVPNGAGLLEQQFLQLKAKLEAEGLFAQAHKKPIPRFPRTVGIITSQQGDVIHDLYRNMYSKIKCMNLILYPATVQGSTAPRSLISQIRIANVRKECDVLIIARGGGSAEDLSCFNNEQLVREIYQSQIPIISAVGHETDVTLCDFVADMRVATPTQAGIFVASNYVQVLNELTNYENFLKNKILETLDFKTRQIAYLEDKLNILNPQNQINHRANELNRLTDQLYNAMLTKLHNYKLQVSNLNNNVSQFGIEKKISNYKNTLNDLEYQLQEQLTHKLHELQLQFTNLEQRFFAQRDLNIPKLKLKINELANNLNNQIKDLITEKYRNLENLTIELNKLNPLTDPRFYKTTTIKNKEALSSINQVKEGDEIITLLKDGRVKSMVVVIEPKQSE